MHFLIFQHVLPLLSKFFFFVLRFQESRAFTCTVCFKKQFFFFKKNSCIVVLFPKLYVNISKSKSKMDYSFKDMQWWFKLFHNHNLCKLFNKYWIISSKVAYVYSRAMCPNTIREPCNRHCKHRQGLPTQLLVGFTSGISGWIFLFFIYFLF